MRSFVLGVRFCRLLTTGTAAQELIRSITFIALNVVVFGGSGVYIVCIFIAVASGLYIYIIYIYTGVIFF